ncbi:MAG: hypothetical protein J6126_03265 [Clostridia bacterium]|nr:hypothetical protein [Clostridia bacterium]
MDINNYKPTGDALRGKSVISAKFLSPEDVYEILHAARLLKMKQQVGERQVSLLGKHIMLVAKTTFSESRIAAELAVKQLGGTPVVLPLSGTQTEAMIEDVDFLPAVNRYGIDGMMVNTDDVRDAFKFAEHAPFPVINAHGKYGPCVALAALMTAWEKFGRLKDVSLARVGNVSDNGFILSAAAKCGMKITVVCPDEFAPDEAIESLAIYAKITACDDLVQGVKGANAVFVTAGDELSDSDDYKITSDVMELAAPNAIFLHPMPVDRKNEAESAVCDGPQSAMLDMAGNLLHVEKAILALTVGKKIQR